MRKTLLTMFIALMGVGANVAHAQVCTPDPTALFLGIPGIYPNPAITSNLTAGNQGQAYSETMTIMVPQDTTIDLSAFIGFPFPAISVSVNFQEVTAITGLPTGLNYTCDLSNCQWGGGVNGCIKLDGTPTQGGSFNVGMSTGYNVSVPQQVPVIGGSAITIPIPGLSWTLDITAVGVADAKLEGLSIAQNTPNPFHGSTAINYFAAKPMNLQFTVTDLTGKQMHSENVRANVGDNTLQFDASDFAPGIYLYRIGNGEKSVTSKMVVQ
jgi:hypothetical protein